MENYQTITRIFALKYFYYFQNNLEREGGSGVYPPPTLHALLVSYLIHNDQTTETQDGKINSAANLVIKKNYFLLCCKNVTDISCR
jgi:hypothetical protein